MSLQIIIQQIKNATMPGENTALRVGSAFEQMDTAKRDKSDSLSKSETIDMVNAVKLLAATGTPFLGTVDPSTAIPAGDFWAFAGEGTYSNAGGIVVGAGEIAIITRVVTTFDSVILDVPVKSIREISKIAEVGLVDNYRIYYTDDSYTDFEVTNGTSGGQIVEIPFSPTVKLDALKTTSKTVLSSNINYTYNNVGALPNAIRVDEIICNGRTISFSSAFTVNIQPDIDYTKPISVLFQKPLMDNLKIFVIVINISEINDVIPVKRYKVKSPSGDTINTWFEYFEFENHTVVSSDVIFNAGVYNEAGTVYHLANFKLLSDTDANRFANFAIPNNIWQPNTVFTAGFGGVSGSGVKVKTTSVKPTSFVAGKTGEFTLVEI